MITSKITITNQGPQQNCHAPTRRVDATPALPVTNVFGYNPRSEVTEALMGDDTYGYAYDPLGNRTVTTENTESTEYVVNNLNQYTNILCVPASLRLNDAGAARIPLGECGANDGLICRGAGDEFKCGLCVEG